MKLTISSGAKALALGSFLLAAPLATAWAGATDYEFQLV